MKVRGAWVAWALVAMQAAVWAVLGLRHGIRSANDTPWHLENARELWDWQALWPHDLWYLTYSTVLRYTGAAAGTYWPVITLQLLLAAVATALLFRWLRRTFGLLPAATATALLVLLPDLQAWHFYLYSESLFVSGSTLVLLALVQAPPRARAVWAVLPLVVLVALVRPTGIALVAAWSVALWQRLQLPKRGRVLVAAGLLALLALLGETMSQGFRYLDSTAKGYVIYGYEDWKLALPPGIAAPDPAQPNWLATLRFWWDAPGYHLQMSGLRLFWQLVPLRPYFSAGHNLYLAAYCLLLYGLAVLGVRRMPAAGHVWGVFLLLLTAIAVVAGVDWDNRFWLPLLPAFAAYAAAGAARIAGRGHPSAPSPPSPPSAPASPASTPPAAHERN